MLTPRNKFGIVSFTAICLAALGMAGAVAQTSVSTVPTGFFTLSIPAGTGSGSSLSILSFPLQGVASADGQMAGVITGVTSNTFTNSNAGWTASQLSNASTPYLLQITSGSAAGRIFLLSTSTANTSTTVTIDANDSIDTPNLAALGITANTDTYQIIPADTILGIFGTAPAIVDQSKLIGGTSSTNVDRVQVYSGGTWTTYYFNTNTNHWTLASFPGTPTGDNVVIRPDSGVVFTRFGTQPLSIVVAGQVPSVNRQALVRNNGLSVISNNWPVDQTLASSNIQTLNGWIGGTSHASAGIDIVQVFNGGTWKQYYYNTSGHWETVNFPADQISDSVVIPAGSLAYVIKQGTASGSTVLAQSIPYSLN